ncbi:uncharacterized protein [Physcomitrium patens]|uniref:uncharacterized protein isoform X2 n=1 Tax=Physcomitrium patens TaxID=3218 RepID=UPI000D152773|nr:uncharacterized protein LOC112287864 isoform X2 [Physcomitrium patens]|eukprot:XP_024387190.1 uncharacterized protein LOC112287864 isoform X2 [Physcomitrella patens]
MLAACHPRASTATLAASRRRTTSPRSWGRTIATSQGQSTGSSAPPLQQQVLDQKPQVHNQQQQQQQQQQNQQKQHQQPPPQQATTKSVSPSNNPNSGPAPANEGRKISCEDIQLVQNLIERCLQLYMNQSEVITTLQYQAKIEPGFTSLVWQKLEEQNPEFFKAYYTRLKLKKQIVLFNHLLEQQVQLMHKMRLIPKTPLPLQNGMHPAPMHHTPMGYPMQTPPPVHSHMQPMAVMPPPNSPLMNGSSAVPDSYHSHENDGTNGLGDMSLGTASSGGSDISLGSMGSTPGGMPGGSFPFANMGPTDMSGMGMGLPTSMGMDGTFASTDATNQNGMGGMAMGSHETDVSSHRESLGSLGQLPRNFSLSDLTAELTNSTGDLDLGPLGSYSGSPFMTPDAFLRSPDKDVLDDIEFCDLKTEPM